MPATPAISLISPDQIPAPHEAATLTLVDQLVQWGRRRIDERVFRPGMRMPSIRRLALEKGVSRFTVVEAYERLVAQGYLDSRRGSGFYVRHAHDAYAPPGATMPGIWRDRAGTDVDANANTGTTASAPAGRLSRRATRADSVARATGTPDSSAGFTGLAQNVQGGQNAQGARNTARDARSARSTSGTQGTQRATQHTSGAFGVPGPEPAPAPDPIDVVWLLRNMLRTSERPEKGPGLGYLPSRWLNGALLTDALRALSRQSGAQLLGLGTPQGFLPLRQQLQTRLAELEIGASPAQIVMVSGITQAIDLIVRLYVQPGDAIVVGDPAWYQMFGRIAAQGARLVGMPYTPDGPDLDALETLVAAWRPRMLVINSVLHNPTGTSLTAAQAFRLLRLAEQYDFVVLEDDIYGDLCPAGYPATRLASLDQLRRVIYLGSFSKTLAPNLRVGYLAAAPDLARAVTDQKMLVGMTSPELNERVLYRMLTEGQYRRHVRQLCARLDGVREKAMRMLERTGLRLFCAPGAGMFVWADTGVDADALTAAGHEAGFLFAPGSLFSPQQSPTTWMRFNVANCGDPALPALLGRYLDGAGRRAPRPA